MAAGAKKSRTIRDFPKYQRPREKLQNVGFTNLTNAELLAIILGSGTAGKNVLKLATEVLQKVPMGNLCQSSVSRLTKLKGVGTTQASKILASVELGRRAYQNLPVKKITCPQDTIKELKSLCQKLREHLVALYLNGRHELIQKQTITIGNLNQNIIEPRDIFAPALALPCAYIILAHNHPSGDPQPSPDDKKLTQKLVKAGDLLGVKLVDHIIVAKKEYFSFREAKQL